MLWENKGLDRTSSLFFSTSSTVVLDPLFLPTLLEFETPVELFSSLEQIPSTDTDFRLLVDLVNQSRITCFDLQAASDGSISSARQQLQVYISLNEHLGVLIDVYEIQVHYNPELTLKSRLEILKALMNLVREFSSNSQKERLLCEEFFPDGVHGIVLH